VPAPALRPLRILLAEDNKINQKFALAVLSKAGHSVEIVENGHQAVDAVRRTPFDVVLMDIQMPELDGVSATRQIRALPAPMRLVPIIAMTANAMAGAKEEYLATGMNGYISKPVQPAHLLAALAEITGKMEQKDPPPFADAVLETHEIGNDNTLTNEPQLLDFEKLADLEVALSLDKLKSFISLYLIDVKLQLASIEDCRAVGDFEGISRHAHSLISVAGNFGADRMSANARRLETACRGGDREFCCWLIDRLVESSELSSFALKIWADGRLAEAQSPVAI
jgi:CheY-like chemotaxis protein/HPt (histidine-containing phosphotransfer) domain-containing protein